MELFLLYLWLKLDSVSALLAILLTFSMGLIGLFWLFMDTIRGQIDTRMAIPNLSELKNRLAYYHSWRKRAVFFSLGCAILLTVFPSSKDVAILVGASLALDVVRSPEGAKVTSLLRGKANEILDAELQKLSPKK